ncbi:MAG: hypothetical protein COA50_04890 [Flavobacteriaceae bacterium]|nr:MAG: hypothetical protein COA50_04890 [Flavobacteriaceae bacterium]
MPVIDSVVSIKNNFYAYPFISATRFGKLGQTSTIDPLLNDNKSSSTFHMGYGAYLIFELDKKMHLRMGGTINNMERNTFDVRINPLVAGTNYYRNITFKEGFSFISFVRLFENIEDITLKEELTNIEVPIELIYLLIDKDLG